MPLNRGLDDIQELGIEHSIPHELRKRNRERDDEDHPK